MDLVDEEIRAALTYSARASFDDFPRQIAELLEERGYVTTDEREKYAREELLESLTYRRKMTSKFSKFVILLTYDCNLRCSYCYERSLRARHKQEWLTKILTENEVDKIFDAIGQLTKKRRMLPITLFGGEPLLPNTKDVLGYLLNQGSKYSFNLYTNGVYLKDFAEYLASFGNLREIHVSLYGTRQIHDSVRVKKNGKGSFDDIVEGVEVARKAGLKLTIDFNLDEKTVANLPSLCHFVRGRGWSEGVDYSSVIICGEGCEPSGDLESILDKLSNKADEDPIIRAILYRYLPLVFRKPLFKRGSAKLDPVFWSCEGLNNDFFAFDPHGDIYSPCLRTVGEPEFKCGSYLPVLQMNDKKQILKSRDVFSIPECEQCTYALLCGGGCVFSAYESGKSIFKPACSLFKAGMKFVAPYFLKKKYGDS